MKNVIFACGKMLKFLVPVILMACGGGGGGGSSSSSSSGSGTSTLSQSSATVLAQHISNGAAYALGSTQFSELSNLDISVPANLDHQELPCVQSILPDENPAIREEQLSPPLRSVQCTKTSCIINQQVSSRTNCTSGGNIQVTGNISGTIDNNGTGMLQIQATETLTDWSCITGYLVQGDPYISLTGQFSFLNGNPATAQTMTLSGGFKWGTTAAPSVVAGSCQINLTANFQSNGHGTLSGTVCGYSVNDSF